MASMYATAEGFGKPSKPANLGDVKQLKIEKENESTAVQSLDKSKSTLTFTLKAVSEETAVSLEINSNQTKPIGPQLIKEQCQPLKN